MEAGRTVDATPKTLAGNGAATLTRRTLLQRAAWLLAATTLPFNRRSSAAMAAELISPVMKRLSEYMSEAHRPRAARCCRRKSQAPHSRYSCRDHLRLGTPSRRCRAQVARAYGGERVATVAASNIVAAPSKPLSRTA